MKRIHFLVWWSSFVLGLNVNAQTIIISELCDPVNNFSNNRYIEIYNPSCSPVDLSGYKLHAISNNSICHTWDLSGTIDSCEAMVCGSPSADGFVVDFVGGAEWDNSSSNCRYNWNGQARDGVELRDSADQLIDYVKAGTGSTPKYFENKSIVRNNDVDAGSSSYEETEWTEITADEYGTPGTHDYSCTCCSEPSEDPSLDTIDSHPDSLIIKWNKNGAENVLVQISDDEHFDLALPANGEVPPAYDSVFGGSDQWIYAGPANQVSVQGLDHCEGYHFKLWSYNCSGNDAMYKSVSNETDSAITAPLMPGKVQDFQVKNISSHAAELTWEPPISGADGYVVKIRETDSVFDQLGDTLPGGDQEPWIDGDIIFTNSNQQFVVVAGLNEESKYHFKIYPYFECHGIYSFNNQDEGQRLSMQTLLNPDDIQVCEGDSLIFGVDILDTMDVEFQWMVQPSGVDTFQVISDGLFFEGSNTDSLTIKSVNSEMAGSRYYCQLKYKHQISQVTPDSGQYCLTRFSAIKLNVLSAPLSPQITNVIYKCDSSIIYRGGSPENMGWFWQGGNHAGTSVVDSSSNLIAYKDTTFFLRARSDEGCWSDFSDSVHVINKKTPVVSISDSSGCGLGKVKVVSNIMGEQLYELLDEQGDILVPSRSVQKNDSVVVFGGINDGVFRARVVYDGCRSSLSDTIQLNNKPIPESPVLKDHFICEPDSQLIISAQSEESVQFSLDGIVIEHADNSGPEYTWNYNLGQDTLKVIYARSRDSSCYSPWVTAFAGQQKKVGDPTAIKGVSDERCQIDITEIYTTSATRADSFTWNFNGAVEGADYEMPGFGSAATETVQWSKEFAGVVVIEVRAFNACGPSDHMQKDTLLVQESPDFTLQPLSQTACENDSVQFRVAVDTVYSYQLKWQRKNGIWQDLTDGGNLQGTSSNILQFNDAKESNSGVYRCQIQTSICDNDQISDEAVLIVGDHPVVNAGLNDSLCLGENRKIGADAVVKEGISPYKYEWVNISDHQIISESEQADVSPVTDSYYQLTVYDSLGCQDKDTVFIRVFNNPEIVVMGDTTIHPGNVIKMWAKGGQTYSWSPQTLFDDPFVQTPVAKPKESLFVEVTGTDDNGCSDEDSVYLGISDLDFYVPDAFTPNGDGVNDELIIRADGYKSFYLRIYNRWGQLVFESKDPGNSWNGRYKNAAQDIQTFGYVLELEPHNGDKVKKEGTITLFK